MSKEEKVIELSDYINNGRSKLIILLENNKEVVLKQYDDMSKNLFKAYGQIEMLKKQTLKKETPVKEAPKKLEKK